jgi:regulatory protein
MTDKGLSEAQRARQAALAYLAGRARSVVEVRQMLVQHGHAAEVVEAVIVDLARLRLLDDRQLASDFVAARAQSQPAASARLADELCHRGVDGAIVTEVLEQWASALDSVSAAKDLLRRQARRYAALDAVRAQRRMAGLLARRGFDQDTVQTAVQAVWKEWEQDGQ